MEPTYFSLFLLLSTTKTPVSICVNKHKTLKYGEKQNGQALGTWGATVENSLGFVSVSDIWEMELRKPATRKWEQKENSQQKPEAQERTD